MMTNANVLQNDYNNLYVEFRKYIWHIQAVQALVDLEIETYTRFPDLDKLREIFDAFKREVEPTLADDEDFREAVDKFEKDMNDAEKIYSDLFKVSEVITVEDNEEPAEPEPEELDESEESETAE